MATLTGERIEELKQQAADHFWPHNNPAGNMDDDGIKLVQSGKGVWVEDVDGEQWFDTMAGMWLKNIGHGRKEVADAVYNQMLDISYTPGGTVSPATAELSGRIASLAPDKDARTYFVSGGSEAVETAIKMAKQYHKNNGEPMRYKVISRRGSYHGATHACMSLGGGGVSAPIHFGPLMPGNIHIANPDSYRNNGGDLQCARDLEIAIQHEGTLDRRGVHRRADFGGVGHPCAASRILAYHPRDMRQVRRHHDLRRGDNRLRAHRQDVRHGALGHQA